MRRILCSTLAVGLLTAGGAWAEGPAALCRKRTPCGEAGRSDAGAGREVVELSLGPAQEEGSSGCERREWWLTRKGAAPVLLLAACNDGYGAAGVGEDSVQVGDNRFTHSRSGGSASRWSTTRVLQLEPLALVEETGEGFHTMTSASSQSSMNWATFRLRSTRTPEACESSEGREQDAEPPTFESLSIPRLAPPAGFEEGGWKQTSLGRTARCSPRTARPTPRTPPKEGPVLED